MKLLLITNFRPDRQESMLRFADMLDTGFAQRDWQVLRSEPRPGFSRLARQYRYAGWPKYLGYIDKFFVFPRTLRRLLRQENPDAIHIVDHANACYGAACGSRRVVVTCHDLMQIRAARGEIPQQHLTATAKRYQNWILGHISRSRCVACVSEETHHQLLRLTSLPPERTSVVPNALNYPYRPVARAKAWQQLQRWPGLASRLTASRDGRGGYILNVGGGQWYKNRPGLIDIFAGLRGLPAMPQTLVMVGKPLSSTDAARAHSLGIEKDIVSLSNLTNAELEVLYSAAEALIFPSWQEGFGWPIAEAQACGCPVFTSNRSPMTDVGGSSASYIDPASIPDAVQKIQADWAERFVRAERGLAEAARWSLGRMLDRYEALYRQSATDGSRAQDMLAPVSAAPARDLYA